MALSSNASFLAGGGITMSICCTGSCAELGREAREHLPLVIPQLSPGDLKPAQAWVVCMYVFGDVAPPLFILCSLLEENTLWSHHSLIDTRACKRIVNCGKGRSCVLTLSCLGSCVLKCTCQPTGWNCSLRVRRMRWLPTFHCFTPPSQSSFSRPNCTFL